MTRSAHQRMPSTCPSVDLVDGKPTLQERRLAPPADGPYVALRVPLMGLCRSDVREVQSARHGRSDFGHELVGVVVQSRAVESLSPGTQVCLDPHVPIERAKGFGPWLLAVADGPSLTRALVPVPADVTPRKAVFCEPLACVCHSFRALMTVLPVPSLAGLDMAVVGAGVSSALFGLLCRHHGAHPVAFFNRSHERLRFLRSTQLFRGSSLATFSGAPRHRYPVVIIATARIDAVSLRVACSLLDRDGVLFVYGGTDSTTPAIAGVNVDRVRRREESCSTRVDERPILVAGAHGATGADFGTSVDLLRSAPAFRHTERLISRTMSLAELHAFLRAGSAQSPPWCGKILVET